jgi:hypothetical protein
MTRGKGQIDGSKVVRKVVHDGSEGETVSATHGFIGTR